MLMKEAAVGGGGRCSAGGMCSLGPLSQYLLLSVSSVSGFLSISVLLLPL